MVNPLCLFFLFYFNNNLPLLTINTKLHCVRCVLKDSNRAHIPIEDPKAQKQKQKKSVQLKVQHRRHKMRGNVRIFG